MPVKVSSQCYVATYLVAFLLGFKGLGCRVTLQRSSQGPSCEARAADGKLRRGGFVFPALAQCFWPWLLHTSIGPG